MQTLIDEFNSFFHGGAIAEIKGNRLSITIDGQTMEIQLPSVVLWKGKSGEAAAPPSAVGP